MGRTPKSEQLKQLEGTSRADRQYEIPNVLEDKANAPSFLTPRAKEWFDETKRRFSIIDGDSDSYTEILTLVALSLEEVEEFTGIIQSEGLTFEVINIKTGESKTKIHPVVIARHEAIKLARSLLSDMGGTPVARLKLGVNKDDDIANKFDEFAGG